MNDHIITPRLVLRPLCTGDLEAVHAYASDREITVYMQYLPNKTREDTLRFLRGVEREWAKERPSCYEFAVTLEGRVIGAVSLYFRREEPEMGEIGWILHRDYQRQGYGLEAAAALRDFARDTLKAKGLTAHCDARNRNSWRLMEKLGMEQTSCDGVRVYRKNGETGRELAYRLMFC